MKIVKVTVAGTDPINEHDWVARLGRRTGSMFTHPHFHDQRRPFINLKTEIRTSLIAQILEEVE